MVKPFFPEKALLFVGALYHNEEYLSKAREKLKGYFGEVLMESPPLEWDYSDYYREEMGWPLRKMFLFFRDAFDPGNLAEIKLLTNEIELDFSEKERRNINLDPGYLTLSKVVLASTKNYSHRIYIGKGIYAEVTLVCRDGRYQPHLFTYPDYASDAYIRLFAKAKDFLKTK